MIAAFLIDNSTGETVQRVTVPRLDLLDASQFGAGLSFVLFEGADGKIEEFETRQEGAGIVVVPRAVDEAERLEIARIALRNTVKQLRDDIEWAGCATPYGPIDTDPDSQRKIGGGSTAALALGPTFEKEWRMADNSIAVFDAAKMVEVGLIVVAHVDACQARKNALDAEISAAGDLTALASITITEGWPT